MAKPDLVFLTEDNQELVNARIDPLVKQQLAMQERQERDREILAKRKIDDAINNAKR